MIFETLLAAFSPFAVGLLRLTLTQTLYLWHIKHAQAYSILPRSVSDRRWNGFWGRDSGSASLFLLFRWDTGVIPLKISTTSPDVMGMILKHLRDVCEGVKDASVRRSATLYAGGPRMHVGQALLGLG